jgi:hypothetical protein
VSIQTLNRSYFCIFCFSNFFFLFNFSINNLRALALQMDEGLGSHVEEFAKELHTEANSSNAEGEGDGEDAEGDDEIADEDDTGCDEAQGDDSICH